MGFEGEGGHLIKAPKLRVSERVNIYGFPGQGGSPKQSAKAACMLFQVTSPTTYSGTCSDSSRICRGKKERLGIGEVR